MSEEDGTFAIDCNDAGVLFVEASSPISAVEVRDDRLIHAYENFSPLDRYALPDIATLQCAPLLAVQVTTCHQGGYVVVVMCSHAVVDGNCAWQFVNSWAQVSRGEQISRPFDFSSRENIINLKPHTDLQTSLIELPPTWKKQEVLPHVGLVSHRLWATPIASKHLFLKVHPEHVKILKSQLAQEDDHDLVHADGSSPARFSSFVAISALLWRTIIRARNIPHSQDSRFMTVIDCRQRCNNLPKTYFGNAILDTVSVANVGELLQRTISFAATTIHNTLQKFSAGVYIQSFSNMMEQNKHFALTAENRGDRDVWTAGMIHNPLSACDFGSGNPCCIKFDVQRRSSIIMWCPKSKPSDAWTLVFKGPLDVADRLLQDPEFMSFMTLDYAR